MVHPGRPGDPTLVDFSGVQVWNHYLTPAGGQRDSPAREPFARDGRRRDRRRHRHGHRSAHIRSFRVAGTRLRLRERDRRSWIEWTGIDSTVVTTLLDHAPVAILDHVPVDRESVLDRGRQPRNRRPHCRTFKSPPAFGHGTMVAGLVHLVAPTARRSCRSRRSSPDGTSRIFDIVRAIYFAVDHGARVINMSFSARRGRPRSTTRSTWRRARA